MRSVIVLASLSLLLTLQACGGRTQVISDPEIVYRDRPVRVEVPGSLLMPCPVASLPRAGDTWEDALEILKQKDIQQKACNQRFEAIRQWQQGENDDGNS